MTRGTKDWWKEEKSCVQMVECSVEKEKEVAVIVEQCSL